MGRDVELEQLHRVQQLADQGHGQVVAIVGEAGVGKSRLVHEFVHSRNTADWLILESGSVSYGRATPYLPVIGLLKNYFKINAQDSTQLIRKKVGERILALDRSLQDAIPPVLDLLDALDENDPFRSLDLVRRRQYTYQAVVRLLLSESHVQPCVVVFEDLHWNDPLSLGLLSELVVACRILACFSWSATVQPGTAANGETGLITDKLHWIPWPARALRNSLRPYWAPTRRWQSSKAFWWGAPAGIHFSPKKS